MSEFSFRMINATNDLVAFCDRARAQGWVALDTEFIREKTYYAQLGLVQLATVDEVVVVDPLQVDNLEPLWALTSDPLTIKVLHSGGEDLELINHCAKRRPVNVFDTQIAATVLGIGDSLGYAALVEQFFPVTLDKSLSRTNWLARPLQDDQLYYAAADVFYLARIYPQLLERLATQERLDMVTEESAAQISKRTRELAPDLAWRDIGNAWQCSDQQRAVLQQLAAWRLQTARALDKPLGFIVKEAALLEIARREPTSLSALGGIADLHPQAIRRYGDAIISCVERGLATPVTEIPSAMPRLDFEPGYKPLFKQAKAEVKALADSLQLPAPFVGSRKQINELFYWYWFTDAQLRERLPTPELLVGWRGARLKSKLEALLLRRA